MEGISFVYVRHDNHPDHEKFLNHVEDVLVIQYSDRFQLQREGEWKIWMDDHSICHICHGKEDKRVLVEEKTAADQIVFLLATLEHQSRKPVWG